MLAWHLLLILSTLPAALGRDPCSPSVYMTLGSIYRSTGFKTAFPEQPLCDEDLRPGWYRFDSEAGGQMPEHCPDRMSCGTVIPVWLNGSHPSVADDVVDRMACANFDSGSTSGSSCCRHEVKVGVKNCTDFFVYLLHPTPTCPMAYCAGDKAPCPVGYWSPTGFPPNCSAAYPKLTTAPTMTGPHVEGKTFHFACQFPYSGNEPNARFEVAWILDGNETSGLPTTVLSGTDREAKLNGSKLAGHLGYNLACKVRSFYHNQVGRSGPWLESNPYWVGVRAEPSHLTISQAVQEQNVTLTSTLPILCHHDLDCCIRMKLDVNGPRDKVVVAHRCSNSLCTDHWDHATQRASIDFKVVASKTQIVDGGSDLLLNFQELIAAGGGSYLDVFSGYQVPSVQVEVEEDPPVSCTMVTDPHITGIDLKRTFNLYKVGDYTAYEEPSRHFEVQVRTWPCNGGRVTCICGVAIREKNDLIRIHGCDKSYYATGIGSPEVEVVGALREGTSLLRSTDGHQISVYFPSGSDVTVKSFRNYGGHMNIFLTIPSADKKKGRGLCGTYDGDDTNDFQHRDGTPQRACSSMYCTPETFTETWKNDRTTSLFKMTPPQVVDDYIPKYCVCDDTTPQSQINCTLNGDNPKTETDMEKLFPEINGTWLGDRRRRRFARSSPTLDDEASIYVDVDDDKAPPFDPDDYSNFVPARAGWPTASGITEHEAESRCTQALRASQLWTHCVTHTAAALNTVDSCKEDVMFADSYDSLDSLVDSFTRDCRTELAKDPDNYVTKPDGTMALKPEVSTDLCSQVCLMHGTCDKGRCVCSAGYTGDSCQLLAGKGPQLKEGARFCDINKRPCRLLYMEATNLQFSNNMLCKVQEILPDGSVSADASFERAVFVHNGKLACHLPDSRVQSDRSVQTFLISASNDGALYGNSVNLTVFDSICQACDTSGCSKLPDTCLIEDLCFLDGDLNPDNAGQMCEISTHMAHWTAIYPGMSHPALSGPTDDGSMVCTVNTNDTSSLARFKVSWFVDGHSYPRQRELNFPTGVLQAVFSLHDLPHNGKLTCKIRSFYSDREVMSPFTVSVPVDLQDLH